MTDLLTGPETAALLGISYTSLARWRDESFGPTPIKVGPYLVYERAAVEAWKAERHPRWLATQQEGIRAKHGTKRRYEVHGCRCDDCKAAKRRAWKRHRDNRKRKREEAARQNVEGEQ